MPRSLCGRNAQGVRQDERPLVRGRGIAAAPPAASAGFSLLELAVVLVVIGLIIGAVSIGRDVQRSAVHQRIASEFVNGWRLAYEQYRLAVGVVPGDNPAAPTGAVNGAPDTPLCGQQLQAMMQARGIAMPQGRAEGAADAYVYLDSNGLPHQLEVCFGQLAWSEPGASVGSHVERRRNVMRLSGLTPALASSLDQFIDGRVDARFGQFRELGQAHLLDAATRPWSQDERDAMAGAGAGGDESQVAELTGLLRMIH